jgi:hypothetical protein
MVSRRSKGDAAALILGFWQAIVMETTMMA